MDLEASVVERLQKLRQWQLEQQERLLKHQQIQREMLTQKQDSMYKALELSIQELDLNEDTLDINNSNETIKNIDNNKNLITLHDKSQIQIINNNELSVNQNINNSFGNIISQQHSPRKKFIEDAINNENHVKRHSKDKTMSSVKDKINLIISPKEEKQIKQFITDGIAPLPPDKIITNHICIDDIPILSPKKDFHTLLEEKLKDSENEPSDKSITSSENKVKKPFLRKGEGLTRFKLNQHKQLTTSKTRSHTALFTSNTQFGSKCSKNKSKSNKTTKCLKNAQLSKGTHCTSIKQKHLCLQNIPLPKKKICSKSDSNTSAIYLKDYVNEMKNTIELNTSDFHSGTQKELEEVRIFELLEEKAENSSFCSTSSAVIAFLQQSTPFKVKNAGYRTENNICSIKQLTPVNKILKEQSVLKSNKCMKSSKDTGTYCDFLGFMNQKIIHDNEMRLQDKGNNTTDANGNKYMLPKDQIQSMHDKQNFCDALIIEDDNEVDVSLHVRFSEYNEYKTIGLTDTSSISTESLITTNFSDEKAWSDSSTSEIPTIESISMPFKIPQSCVVVKNKMQELNYETQSCQNTKQNKSTCNTDVHQYKDELELSNIEDQTSNSEMSSLCKYNQNDSTSQESNNSCNNETFKQYTKEYENRRKRECVNNYNDVIITEDQENKKELQETNESIFKSELLKNRLLELEQEINIFRKENAALSIQRKKLHEDYKNMCKEYVQKEKSFEENRKQVEECLQEERKKLAREKAALENRMRDSQEKAQQSKLERQEIQNLKQEIEKLIEEMHIKESRWNAAQSRHKCQMRILKMENSKLKQEIERLQNLKKNNVRNKVKCGISTNTRAIHQINKQLNMQFKKSQKMNHTLLDDDQNLVESMVKTMDTINSHTMTETKEHNYNDNNNVMNDKSQKSQTTMVDVVKKRNLYENLIKEATLGLTEIQEQFNAPENVSKSKPVLNSKLKILDSKTNVAKDNYEKSYKEGDIPSNHNSSDDNIQLYMQNSYSTLPIEPCDGNHEKDLILISPDKSSNKYIENTSLFYQNKTDTDKQGIIQNKHSDGSIEYHFPNGNIKKIFPDQGITKLIYYNGDIRETNEDGKIKYFYASTQTWHTTMPDGLEILEFADGQVERRSHNGTVEVSFPDGSLRILESDGVEKWTLPDGTLIQILTNGERILTLPNGQREIHTNSHKRREYPDGTIKLIYLDGTQETRYSNGRIRLKDKDGNLLMDSYQ